MQITMFTSIKMWCQIRVLLLRTVRTQFSFGLYTKEFIKNNFSNHYSNHYPLQVMFVRNQIECEKKKRIRTKAKRKCHAGSHSRERSTCCDDVGYKTANIININIIKKKKRFSWGSHAKRKNGSRFVWRQVYMKRKTYIQIRNLRLN